MNMSTRLLYDICHTKKTESKMYQFIDSVDPREHDAFVKAHPLCNLLQSSAWAEVKSN